MVSINQPPPPFHTLIKFIARITDRANSREGERGVLEAGTTGMA